MKLPVTFLALFVFSNCFSQEAIHLTNYDHKTLKESTLKIYADNGSIELTVIKPNLIKVCYLQTTKSSDVENVKPKQEFIRITQNLENIYMLTDSLLIIISKLDFSIKFQNLKEQLYTTTQSISFSKDGLNLTLSTTEDEKFYNSKQRNLKLKKYSLHKLKSISSSKNYELSFDKNSKGNLDFRNPLILDVKFAKPTMFGYYFKSTN